LTKHVLRMCAEEVLRKIFRPKEIDISEQLRILLSEKLRDLHR